MKCHHILIKLFILETSLVTMLNSTRTVETTHYDKAHNSSFPIVNIPFLRNNIPAAPAYGVYFSQLIRYIELAFPMIDRQIHQSFNLHVLHIQSKGWHPYICLC